MPQSGDQQWQLTYITRQETRVIRNPERDRVVAVAASILTRWGPERRKGSQILGLVIKHPNGSEDALALREARRLAGKGRKVPPGILTPQTSE